MEMGSISMNALKTDNMNGVDAQKVEQDATKINAVAEDTSKDILKPTATETQKDDKAKVQKHVVSYIGSGEYKDSTGRKWHKHDEETYDEEEYATRKDLHFMVNYGEMKHTVVTM